MVHLNDNFCILSTPKFSCIEYEIKSTKTINVPEKKSSGLSFLSMLSGGFAQSMFDDGEESEQREGKKKIENSDNTKGSIVDNSLIDSSLQNESILKGDGKEESISILENMNIEQLIIDVANGIAFQKFKKILAFLEKTYWEEKCPKMNIKITNLTTTTIEKMNKRSPNHYILNQEKLLDLQEEGYMVLPRINREAETRREKSLYDNNDEEYKNHFTTNIDIQLLKDSIKKIQEIGWPPIFALVYDEFWYLLKEVHEVAMEILGCDCVLEPSIFIWSLQRKNAKETKIGQNFGLPHRDFSYLESFFDSEEEDNNSINDETLIEEPDIINSSKIKMNTFSILKPEPKILNVWIPLVDTNHNNGCLCVLPKEFDTVFDQPNHHDHMRAAIPVKKYNYEDDTQSIDYYKTRIDMGGVRALQVEKGTMISWVGNLIHYGSACSSKAKEPRVSIAFTFRNQKAQKTHLCQDNVFADIFKDECFILPSFEMRLRMICKSLLIYQDWYQLVEKNFPPNLFDQSN